MGRERGEPASPDLFSAEVVQDAFTPSPGRPGKMRKLAESSPQRHVLPKNLPNAVKHLSDEELALLHAATFDEMKRRGKAPPSNSGVLPRNSLAERSPKRATSLAASSICAAMAAAASAGGVSPSAT
jgi:hypothetical protein